MRRSNGGNKKIIYICLFLVILCLSIGYSAFSVKLAIDGIAVGVRIEKDIRVTGVNIYSSNSDAISNYEDYNVNSINGEIYLPNDDSSITYKIDITNFESPEMGILSITGLPDNLDYYIHELSNYNLKEKICDNDNKCSLGITKELYITIGYKDGINESDITTYGFELVFDFRHYHAVTYENIVKNYPSEVIDGSDFELVFSNYVPESVKVYFDGVETSDFTYSGNVLKISNVTTDIKIVSYVESPSISNNGLIPIKYNGDDWVVCDSTDESWYDYGEQKWANAVILNDDVAADVGDVLDVNSDIRAMFVWIPRYEYKISVDGTNEVYINFISTEQTTSSSSDYIIPPAFSFNATDLSGIWFGKFETSANTSSTCYSSPSISNCNNSSQEPFIVPNVNALREQTIYYQYVTALKMVNYLDDSTNTDSHMVKSSEWGVVAYLSQSMYGKYGNPNYTGSNKEIYANASPSLITGMSGGTPNYSSSEELYTYDVLSSSNGEENGVGASTTGNITGIYDMNGGAYEYTMGYLSTASSTWGATSSYDYAGFSSEPSSYYYDDFTSTDINSACNGNNCYGYAFDETAGWYDDDATFVTSANPWIMRGGVFDSNAVGGIFSYSGTLGYSGAYATFRIALVIT